MVQPTEFANGLIEEYERERKKKKGIENDS